MSGPYTDNHQDRLVDKMRSSALGPINIAPRHPDDARPMQIYGYLALCLLIIGGIWLFPRGTNLIIVSNPFGPASEAMDIVSATNSYFVAGARFPWIASVYSSEPDFMRRLFSAGALFVIRDYAPMSCFQEQSQ
jgi:hypothetical protein